MNALIIDTPLGSMRLEEDGCGLCRAQLLPECQDASGAQTPLLLCAKAQLNAYFAGRCEAFDLPLSQSGTPFELAVWQALSRIPYGQTRTYGQIAREIGKPGATRAVGRACGKNPLHIIIPCHRVIGSDGRLTGFAAGEDKKRALLALERALD